jgi:predicted alpha-1,6-mannanase (GH76 family)
MVLRFGGVMKKRENGGHGGTLKGILINFLIGLKKSIYQTKKRLFFC